MSLSQPFNASIDQEQPKKAFNQKEGEENGN
jgi:hypothetical protein